jgi:hypothetical protein
MLLFSFDRRQHEPGEHLDQFGLRPVNSGPEVRRLRDLQFTVGGCRFGLAFLRHGSVRPGLSGAPVK